MTGQRSVRVHNDDYREIGVYANSLVPKTKQKITWEVSYGEKYKT